MPNWCSTNYLLRGDKEELEEFANMLNTMPNNKNGFGRYWIGNLLITLGFTDEDIMVGCVYIKKRFPSFEFSWTSTDEFGNFHLVHDPYGEMR